MPRKSDTPQNLTEPSPVEQGEPSTQPARKAPDLVWDGEQHVTVNVTEEDQLRTLYGTKTDQAAEVLLSSALNALGQKRAEYDDLMTAMPVEMEPRDAVEAMLVTQMAATHVAMTKMSQRVHHAPSCQMQEAYERSMTRLSRTFLCQVEQLRKYRAKAQQVVRVERVEVNEGGRAIVGDVSYRRGEDDET